jgi:membrane protease subunit (stomatin/prohibitin family)
VTNDTKCHFKINVTFTYKTIQIKINKNYNETDMQAHSTYSIHKTKYISYKQISNNIKMINKTKILF